MEDIKNLSEQFKELNDVEFEIIFVDSVYKKLKSLTDKSDISTATLLFAYYSVVETLKKYRDLATEIGRDIPYKYMLDLIISKCDSFLTTVAENENKAPYVYKSLTEISGITKELLLLLKTKLVEMPEYNYLKKE